MTNPRLFTTTIFDKTTTSETLTKLYFKSLSLPSSSQGAFLTPPSPLSFTAKDLKISSQELKKALSLIKKTIKSQGKIVIYGDYDVDGICATAILQEALHSLGAKVISFLPHREIDGYGINPQALARIYQKHPDLALLISVDNGIVALPAAAWAAKNKINLIITDHHLPGPKLPQASAIVHSTSVAGAAVSWFLAKSLGYQGLDLLSLGTVADCLPLLGVNRSFLVHGLASLSQAPRPGLQALLEKAGLSAASLTTFDLSFGLAPRLNASGRLDTAFDSLRLLLAPDLATARPLASILEKHNRLRQDLQEKAFQKAEKIWLSHPDPPPLIFVADTSFHPGIIGLIAGKLTEKYSLPSIAISLPSQKNEIAKASCRAPDGINILEFLQNASADFSAIGGHAAAAGFSFPASILPRLQESLETKARKNLLHPQDQEALPCFAKARLSFLSLKNYRLLQSFAPFGIGNPQPLFYFENLKILQKRIVGRTGLHLQLKLDDPLTAEKESIPASAVAFRQAHLDQDLKTAGTLSLAAYIELNDFQGHQTIQLRVKKIFLEDGKNKKIKKLKIKTIKKIKKPNKDKE